MSKHAKQFYTIIISFTLILQGSVQAQFIENFDDGDLTAPIVWTYAPNTWKTSTDGRLQSVSNISNSTFSISTPVVLQPAQQWQLAVELDFNPSSSNYVDIYLQADSSDVTKPTCGGYFVRLGNTQDRCV